MEFLMSGKLAKKSADVIAIGGESPTNGAESVYNAQMPYVATVIVTGVADFLYHAWNVEAVEAKANAAKGSRAKKTDDLESYVYRCDNGNLGIPGSHLRGAIINAARFRQDPRSPRKSAMDLYKAGVVVLTSIADMGRRVWDYEDRRRAQVQRNAITRVRPALKTGWRAEFDVQINLPEYISESDLNEVIANAGRLFGMGDHRPTFGRFQITAFGLAG
jgi:hypothetical protein